MISIITIYNTNATNTKIITKQIIWYILGFSFLIFTSKFKFKKILNYAPTFYIIGNMFLLFLLFYGTEVNGSKCWFQIGNIISFQPSEFMKLALILMNAKILEHYNKTNKTFKDDLKIFCIIGIITIIPSILTFLEPDTGMVIIYLIISFIMLYIYGIKNSIFIAFFLIVLLFIFSFFYFYKNYQNSFINIFGTSFFYRIDRILDWSNSSSMQLTNALASIKAAGLFGFGINKIPIYIPEAHTDFIFSVYASSFGFIGVFILLGIIIYFDYMLFYLAFKTNDKTYRLIIMGFTMMILYQQIQNIGMNIGLLPITGITLPFISYGGSSLLSYILGLAIILNYDKIILE